MRAAGAQVSFCTVLGEDELRDFVLDDLSKANIECHAVVDRTRPTTHKERFIAEGYKMLQVDRVDNRPVSQRVLREICEVTEGTKADIVIFSDFRHGIFNRESIKTLRDSMPKGALKVADSQVSNRWGNVLDFTDFDLLTPNEREVRFALGDQDSVVRPLGLELYRRARCRELFLKLGERGLLVYRNKAALPRDTFVLDSFVDTLVDPIGAGDAFLAYSSLSRVASDNIVVASILGSFGAAIACERQGNNPVPLSEVEKKLDQVERQARYE
jgi:bifunctional ADP-heptose synthase (sugar kinase/adenylyltransferase)